MAVLVKLAIHLVFVKQASKLKDSPIHTKWMEEPPPPLQPVHILTAGPAAVRIH